MPIFGGAVLIADDDEYFRLALSSLIRGHLGISDVLETGSLDEALGQLAEPATRISLALFDLSMPGMNGPGTLAAVRECYPDVQVVVVSSSQNRRDVLTSLDTGVHGYIPKGFGPLELVRALKIVISGDIFVPAFLANPAPFDPRWQMAGPTVAPFVQDTVGEGKVPENRGTFTGEMAAISGRQREVLAMLVKGYSNKQIASELSIRDGTVKFHVASLLRSLGVANRAGAAAAGAILLRD